MQVRKKGSVSPKKEKTLEAALESSQRDWEIRRRGFEIKRQAEKSDREFKIR